MSLLTTAVDPPCVCSSVVRSFRLAGSLAAHQVVTSLIRARLSLADARDTAQRQLAAEEKKKASKVPRPPQGYSSDLPSSDTPMSIHTTNA